MTYESRRPTEPRYIVRWYADDRDDPESGGEWCVIDDDREEIVASYGVWGAALDDFHEAQRTAAVMHARSLNG